MTPTAIIAAAAPRRFLDRLHGLVPTPVAGLACLTAGGAALRFATLGDQSFWAEEAITRGLLEQPFVTMLETIPTSESTPPLYYVLAWMWTHAFGTSEVGIRSWSALVGTLTIPVGYAAARTLTGRMLSALAVAAFVAVSPVMVWYAQESRSYASYVFFAALVLLFVARSLRYGRRFDLWAWAVMAVAAVATHYVAAFVGIASAAVLLHRFGRRAVAPVASAMAVALALAPLALYQHEHIQQYQGIASRSVPSRVWDIGQRWIFLSYNPGRDVALALAVVVAAVLAWRGRRVGQAGAALAIGAVGLIVPITLAFSTWFDVFTFRNVLAAWLPVAVAVAAGLPRGRAGVALTAAASLVLLASTLAVATRESLQRDSWRQAVTAVRGAPTQNRVLVSEDYFTPPLYWPGVDRVTDDDAVQAVEIVYVSRYASAASRFERLPGFRPVEFRVVGNMGVLRLRAQRPEPIRESLLPPGIRLMRIG